MVISFLRSSVFNALFYILTGVACIICLPTLFLPRRYFMGVVHGFVRCVYALECIILGPDLEIHGEEYLPAEAPYIIAMKHQSAYETLKLHLLFKDPAVILKQELLRIPLWGLYLKKSDPIAIDRSNPGGARASIEEGAKRVAAQGRPLVIFPQGTRVGVDQSAQEKPYKMGVARVQEATGLPIIPVALNSGIFWPKHGWVKHGGRVALSFLPPILPGKDKPEVLAELEEQIESESLSLMNKARENLAVPPSSDKGGRLVLWAIMASALLLFGFYSFIWFEVAKQTKVEYVALLENLTGGRQVYAPPQVTGYPGKMRLYVERETLQNDRGRMTLEDLHVQGWPLPQMPIEVKTAAVTLHYFKWQEDLVFESLEGRISLEGTLVHILDSTLTRGDFKMHLRGDIDTKAKPAPLIDLSLSAENPQSFLNALGESGIIERHMPLFIGAGMASFKDEAGQMKVPVYQKDFTLFVGPLPVMSFEREYEYDSDLGARLIPIP